jgi:hypothetical protein
MQMKTEDLLALLADVSRCIQADDSYEGSLVWEATMRPHEFEVYASYRVGNSMGQGGVVLVERSKEVARAEEDGDDPW